MERPNYDQMLDQIVYDLDQKADFQKYSPINYLPEPLMVEVLSLNWSRFMEEIEERGFVLDSVIRDKQRQRPLWIFEISESAYSSSSEYESPEEEEGNSDQ